MSNRRRIGDALPPGAKKHLLNTIFRAYGGLARTRLPYQYLFVLSHMRSGSSLLAMLLGNSPEICGYGETMLAYQSPRDLELLAGNNLYRLQPFSLPGSERYMLDKLVHDDLLTPDKMPMLSEVESKFVFLIREPAGTISSMVNMVELDETIAASIYIKRLATMQQYGQALPDSNGAFLLSYDDLVARTDKTLAALSSFLDLQTLLSADYEVLRPMKGRAGDHYRKLHLGRVDDRKTDSTPMNVSERTLQVARDAYDGCWSTLSAVCQTAVQPE